MNGDWLPILMALAAIITSVSTFIFDARRHARQDKSDTDTSASRLTGSALGLVTKLEDRCTQLQTRIQIAEKALLLSTEKFEVTIAQFKEQVTLLTARVVELEFENSNLRLRNEDLNRVLMAYQGPQDQPPGQVSP